MKVIYRAPESDDKKIMAFGIVFENGVAVDVSDARAIEKIKNNRFFEIEKKYEESVIDGRTKAARDAKAQSLKSSD